MGPTYQSTENSSIVFHKGRPLVPSKVRGFTHWILGEAQGLYSVPIWVLPALAQKVRQYKSQFSGNL